MKIEYYKDGEFIRVDADDIRSIVDNDGNIVIEEYDGTIHDFLYWKEKNVKEISYRFKMYKLWLRNQKLKRLKK